MKGSETLHKRGKRAKSVALFVIGGSPAILTETLSAYATESNASIPHEIRITTTTEGKKRLKQRFLDAGGWDDFVCEYPEYAEVLFDESVITVAGELNDIRCEDDSKIMMAAIFRMVQACSAAGDVRILASIAGGRKTMSYYLGFAMSLFGQQQDRITHVLVPSEWERDREFLFPARSEAARISLIDTPFIRLSGLLKPDINQVSVEEMIALTQSTIDTAAMQPLTVNFNRSEVGYLGKTHRLSPREFTFYSFFLWQKRRHCRHQEQEACGSCTDCYLDYEQMSDEQRVEDLKMIRKASGGAGGKPNDPTVGEFIQTWGSFESFKNGFPEVKSRINNRLKRGFGLLDGRVDRILLDRVNASGYARFGVAVDKSQIRIEMD